MKVFFKLRILHRNMHMLTIELHTFGYLRIKGF